MAGRVVVVTGATGGVGAALADAFGDEQLVLLGRNRERLAELARHHPGSRTVAVDLAEPETAGPAVSTALDQDESIDVLVHNAGVAPYGPLEAADSDAWSTALAVNTVAPALLTAALLPRLRSARGHVVFIGSGQSRSAGPGLGIYAATKFALRAVADVLRAEEAGSGVRVTSVYPGRIATGMQRRLQQDVGGQYRPEDYIAPASLAAAVRFAVDSPRDSHLTEITVRPGE